MRLQCPVQCSAVQCNAVQCSAVQYSAVPTPVQFGPVSEDKLKREKPYCPQ